MDGIFELFNPVRGLLLFVEQHGHGAIGSAEVLRGRERERESVCGRHGRWLTLEAGLLCTRTRVALACNRHKAAPRRISASFAGSCCMPGTWISTPNASQEKKKNSWTDSHLLSPDLFPSGGAVGRRALWIPSGLRIRADARSRRITVGWSGYRSGLVDFLGWVVWQPVRSSAVDVGIHRRGRQIAGRRSAMLHVPGVGVLRDGRRSRPTVRFGGDTGTSRPCLIGSVRRRLLSIYKSIAGPTVRRSWMSAGRWLLLLLLLLLLLVLRKWTRVR